MLQRTLQKQIHSMKERNFFEIAVIVAVVENLILSGVAAKRIGVVTVTED